MAWLYIGEFEDIGKQFLNDKTRLVASIQHDNSILIQFQGNIVAYIPPEISHQFIFDAGMASAINNAEYRKKAEEILSEVTRQLLQCGNNAAEVVKASLPLSNLDGDAEYHNYYIGKLGCAEMLRQSTYDGSWKITMKNGKVVLV